MKKWLKRTVNKICDSTGIKLLLLLLLKNWLNSNLIPEWKSSTLFTHQGFNVCTLFTCYSVEMEACDCDYHSGGCVISRGAPAGSKCKCIYKGAWTCRGTEIGCDAGENCPGGCRSKKCCNAANGDCGGYWKLNTHFTHFISYTFCILHIISIKQTNEH